MKEIRRKELLAGIILLATFALWTVLIRHIDVQKAGPNGTEIDSFICFHLFIIYGDRQTDFRRPLGNGYYWLRFPEFRSVYGLSIHGRIYWVQKKHLTAEA